MTSLILDIRDNPGGILDQAIKVAGKFLQSGQIVVTRRVRHVEIDNRTLKALNKGGETIPLVSLSMKAARRFEIVARCASGS